MKFASALVIVAATCWGFIGLFSSTLAAYGYNAVQITWVRCVVVFVLVGVGLLVARRELLRIRARDLWVFLGSGVASFAFFNVCYFFCIQECTLSVAVILLYTGPIFVMVLSCLFLGERFTGRKAVALVLAITGCLFVVGIFSGNFSLSLAGVLAGLGSGLGYGLYSIFGNLATKREYHPFTIVFYTFLFATIALAPLADIPAVVAGIGQSVQVPLAMCLIAVISTLVPFVCYTTGLKYLEPGRASIMCFVEPLVATVIGVSVLGDVFTIFSAIGIVLIGVALVVLNTGANKSAQNDAV